MPWFLWPFVIAGLLLRGARRRRPELIAFAPLLLTSLAIVLLLAIDPRTQLLLAPALAWYAARGIGLAADALEKQAGSALRPGFVRVLCSGTALLVLLGMDGRRLWLGLGADALHQVVGSANRQVGETLQRLVPGDESVMSWNPAVVVWAERDWRPLPTETLPRILRFAEATKTHWVVFSTLNPSPIPKEQMPRAFLIARVLPGAAAASRWSIRVSRVAEQHAVGTIGPSAAGEGP